MLTYAGMLMLQEGSAVMADYGGAFSLTDHLAADFSSGTSSVAVAF
jgi:hypothetical protein